MMDIDLAKVRPAQRAPLVRLICAGLVLAATLPTLFADQIEMQNGDRYFGHVTSLTADSVIFQNENLGRIVLQRGKVTLIALGTNAPPPSAGSPAVGHNAAVVSTAPSGTLAGANPDIAAALKKLGGNTNFIGEVRGQLLSGAGPEANQKFDDLVGGLMSGRLNMNDLRGQAKSAADQLRALKHDLGPDAGDSLDSYLEVLDNFLNQTTPKP